LALNSFFGWNLSQKELSILARLGSGSACRSIYSGFVQWNKGERDDGMDSFAEPFNGLWQELQFGIYMVSKEKKPIDSRTAMQKTVTTSPLYTLWPENVKKTISQIKEGIQHKNFSLFGSAIEQNALTMHATMFTTHPPICYWQEESLSAMRQIWKARQNGIEVYFTMDAGPNIKVLFLEKEEQQIRSLFPELSVIPLVF
jgi:diphosphomevalonate decarboxylase